VQLTQLRWQADVLAPRVFRVKTVEPEKPPEVRTILFRHFEVEVDQETGQKKVVGYCPNPYTRQMEREATPGWRQPGGKDVFSLPGGRIGGRGRNRP
jgi:hypothetical protein